MDQTAERDHETNKYLMSPPNNESANDVVEEESENVEPLVHPVPSMQEAFEESIQESTEENDLPDLPAEHDAQARRHRVLEASEYDDSWMARWKQRPTARYHPLLKLMAQIVFGMHLLQQQQAKSEKEVVKILQTHVNEVDTFLEKTAEDFDVAIRDMEDRIRYLKLPMAHMDVFEVMLDDKKFRTQLLTGNEKIEKIIERTIRAVNASLLDIEVGTQANKELGRYMKSVQNFWPLDQRAICDVFGAMRGNEHGWRRYMRDLQSKASNLARVVAQLQRLIADMSRMAAAASRRNKTQSSTVSPEPKSPPTSSSGPRSKFSSDSQSPAATQSSPRSSNSRSSNLNKPLPQEPPIPSAAPLDSTAKAHPVPFADRYERPRQSPPDPTTPPRPSTTSTLPRTRPGSAREARAADSRMNPTELIDFFQRPDPLRSNPNPLRSNPPDDPDPPRPGSEHIKHSLGRSQSQGANLMLRTVEVRGDGQKVVRSRSQGAIDSLVVKESGPVEKVGNVRHTTVEPARPSTGSAKVVEVGDLSTEQMEKRDAMRGTGFARRLSKRLKHLPLNTDTPPTTKTPATTTTAAKPSPLSTSHPSNPPPTSATATPTMALRRTDPSPPTDSAYHSLRDKPSPPNELSSSLDAHPTLKPDISSGIGRPESVIGPLPFETGYSDAERGRSLPATAAFGVPVSVGVGKEAERSAASVKSLASGRSRTVSVRNFLRGRWRRVGGRGGVVVA